MSNALLNVIEPTPRNGPWLLPPRLLMPAIIDQGRIAVVGDPATLQGQLRQDVVLIEVAGTALPQNDRLPLLDEAVTRLSSVKGTAKDGNRLKIYVDRSDTALFQILQAAHELAVPVQSISHSRPGLDEVFLHYTGHAFEEGARENA